MTSLTDVAPYTPIAPIDDLTAHCPYISPPERDVLPYDVSARRHVTTPVCVVVTHTVRLMTSEYADVIIVRT